MKRGFMNDRGVASLLSVAILSMIIVTSLATVHMYLDSRSRYHSRIRKAYQSTFVMEDLSKLVYNAAESYKTNQPGGCCPAGSAKFKIPGALFNGSPVFGCFPSCPSQSSSCGDGTDPSASLCVRDPYGKSVCLDGRADPCQSSLFHEVLDGLIAEMSNGGLFWSSAAADPGPSPGPHPRMKTPPICETCTPGETGDAKVCKNLCQKCENASSNCPTLQICASPLPGKDPVCSKQIIRLDPAIIATPPPGGEQGEQGMQQSSPSPSPTVPPTQGEGDGNGDNP